MNASVPTDQRSIELRIVENIIDKMRGWRSLRHGYDALEATDEAELILDLTGIVSAELAGFAAGASDELAAELLADDALLQKAIALYATENRDGGPWIEQGRRTRIAYLRRARTSSPEPREKQDAARYQFLRGLHDPGPDDPRVHTLDQQHDPVQVRLCFGDDLDAAVDAAMRKP